MRLEQLEMLRKRPRQVDSSNPRRPDGQTYSVTVSNFPPRRIETKHCHDSCESNFEYQRNYGDT